MTKEIAEFAIVRNITAAGTGNKKLFAWNGIFLQYDNTASFTLNSCKQTCGTSANNQNISYFQNRDLIKVVNSSKSTKANFFCPAQIYHFSFIKTVY